MLVSLNISLYNEKSEYILIKYNGNTLKIIGIGDRIMNKAKTAHKVIFPIYGFDKKDEQQKDTIRRRINNQLKEAYGNKKWAELSDIQQKRFVCFTARDVLMEYVSGDKKRAVERRLNEYANLALVEAQAELERYNERADIAEKRFYPETDDETVKKKAYNDFRAVLKKYYDVLAVPTYQEWVDENERALKKNNQSLQISDYVHYSLMKEQEKEAEYSDVSQKDIDYLTIQTVLKVLKTELKIEIDIDKIRKCLSFLNTITEPFLDDNENILTQYNPNLPIDRKKQQVMIDTNIQLQQYSKMKEDLDFIIHIKK